ncbi:MAG: spoIIIJ-associated protein [Propionibacteriaceae bacterium]|nr:spoIIIJ-associated protein [Propionibacteriaceae bacterium]
MSDTQNENITSEAAEADSAGTDTAGTDAVGADSAAGADSTEAADVSGPKVSDDSGDLESEDDDDSDDDEDEDDENPLEVEAEIAADYLEELLDIADLDGDIDTYIEGNRAHVSIVSQSETLVGADGQVLDALQELARLAVMTETGDRSRLMLDISGYRDRRRKQLIDLATDAVEEVKANSEPVALAPMNPFERKIVHDAVAAAGLTSASEGEEPKRRVVVQPSA